MSTGRRIIQEMRRLGACADCGRRGGLEFDHRDPSEKLFNIGAFGGGVLRGVPQTVKALVVEIAKCDLVCPQHHLARKRQRGEADDGQLRLWAS